MFFTVKGKQQVIDVMEIYFIIHQSSYIMHGPKAQGIFKYIYIDIAK